jgi:hypothetical protein
MPGGVSGGVGVVQVAGRICPQNRENKKIRQSFDGSGPRRVAAQNCDSTITNQLASPVSFRFYSGKSQNHCHRADLGPAVSIQP